MTEVDHYDGIYDGAHQSLACFSLFTSFTRSTSLLELTQAKKQGNATLTTTTMKNGPLYRHGKLVALLC